LGKSRGQCGQDRAKPRFWEGESPEAGLCKALKLSDPTLIQISTVSSGRVYHFFRNSGEAQMTRGSALVDALKSLADYANSNKMNETHRALLALLDDLQAKAGQNEPPERRK
jgi:hypothetical protein